LLRGHGDANVVVVLVDDVVALDLGVELWDQFQRVYDGLDEEGHEAEADAVALLERVPVLLAEVHHGGHVDLVEGREEGGRLLRLDQSGGDRAAERAHPHALLLASAARGRLTHRRGGVATGALSSLALALLDEALYVLLEQASAGAGGLYVVGGEPVLVEQALRRRHHAGGTLWLRRRLGDRRSGVGRGCGGCGRGAASGAR